VTDQKKNRLKDPPPVSRTWRTLVVVLFWAYVLLNTYFVLTPVLGEAPSLAYLLVPLLLGGFSLSHAITMLGWRHAIIFAALSAVISLAFEAAGVATGAIYGPYHYADLPGPRLFNVPLVIPMAWFMGIYPSYAVANTLADGRVVSRPRPRLGRLTGLAALSAMLMTAWDLVLDPQMVTAGQWVWHVDGAYFGIPMQNFVGWLATTLTVYLAYRTLETRWPPRPWGAASRAFERLPLIIYALLASGYAIGYVLLGRPALALIAIFAMGTPCLAAMLRATSKTGF
jgi:putative membrane protein